MEGECLHSDSRYSKRGKDDKEIFGVIVRVAIFSLRKSYGIHLKSDWIKPSAASPIISFRRVRP